jgi:hypothetical protein
MRKVFSTYCTSVAYIFASNTFRFGRGAHACPAAMLRCAMHSVHVHGPDGCPRCSLRSASVLVLCMKYSFVPAIARPVEL